MSEDTAKAKAALERAVQAAYAAQADELHAHRYGSIADQQVARQALWNALHARDVARLELRVVDLNERCRASGYAQDVDDAVDAEAALALLKAAGPRTDL
jgi:hypothetical protein